MREPRIAIVGAGISGLTAAYRLHQQRPDATLLLFEAAAVPGGKIRTLYEHQCIVESGADSFLSRKRHGVELCEELGLADALIGRNPAQRQTHILKDGVLHKLPSGLTGLIPTDLVALRESSLLSAETLARLAQEPAIPARRDNGDESVAAFFTRRFGHAIFDQLIQPLMGGIYGGEATRLSMMALFPQLRALEQTHGSVLTGLAARDATTNQRYPPFVSLKNGMGQLIDTLVAALPHGVLQLRAPINRVAQTPRGYVLNVHGETIAVDAVVMATAAPVAAQLLQHSVPMLSAALATIEYGRSTIVTYLFDETKLPSLPVGYGLLVPRSENATVLACSWSSNKWVGRASTGNLLARFFLRGAATDQDLAALHQFMHDQLDIMLPPQQRWLQRWPHAIPHYTLGHGERIATINQLVDVHNDLALAGAYFDGVGVPDCVRWGQLSAEKIATFI